MKNVLVTGGAGFIGSNFLRYLLKSGHKDQIVNLDALTYAGNLNNLQGLREEENYHFYQGDITDAKLVGHIFHEHRIHWVVNFAAETHVDRSILDSQAFIKTNVMGTQVLLDEAKKAWTEDKDPMGYPVFEKDVAFLQVSTDEVYGALGETGLFTEETPLDPSSPYSASKASADLLALAYHKTYKMPVNITRCSNNYGPYQFPEKLIPLMIENALTEKPLPVYGDGRQIRDWLHVDDHCKAIVSVLQKGKAGEVYNIGGNNEKANIDIVKRILQVVEKPETLIRHVEDRLGHDRRYAVDNTKITSELGWQPEIAFEDGIRQTIDWYLKNEKWLRDISSGDYRLRVQATENQMIRQGKMEG